MKQNILRISIERPIDDVFDYTINPANTPLWIESVSEEKTSAWPIELGTEYKNTSDGIIWNSYKVSALAPNTLFQLTSIDGNFHVRYSYKAESDTQTELEYNEWVENGEIECPFSQEPLEVLKQILEKQVT